MLLLPDVQFKEDNKKRKDKSSNIKIGNDS
jgi:hypothetical protein